MKEKEKLIDSLTEIHKIRHRMAQKTKKMDIEKELNYYTTLAVEGLEQAKKTWKKKAI